ncbi:hypothetical protein ACI2KT_00965 [Ensifer adhaerens]|uniref:hypothetical protein n=1 Tax=Ensifer adhaerens TaxID=106592 RepID=UPI00384F8F95
MDYPALIRWEDHIFGSHGYIETDQANPLVEIRRDHLGAHRVHIGVNFRSADEKISFFQWIPIHDGVFRQIPDAKEHASLLVAQWLWQNVANAA